MRFEIMRPHRHPIAIAVSLVLVAVLTGIGVWTGQTASRQSHVEHTVKVERVRVDKLLCNSTGDFTDACKRHATRLIEACLVTPSCAALLRKVQNGEIPLPESSAAQSKRRHRSCVCVVGASSSRPDEQAAQHLGGRQVAPPRRHHRQRGAGPPAPGGPAPPPAATPSQTPPPLVTVPQATPPGEPEPKGLARGLTECVATASCAVGQLGKTAESAANAAPSLAGN